MIFKSAVEKARLLPANQPAETNLDAAMQAELKTWTCKHYRPYVEKLAKNLARRKNDPVEDLVQVGMIGLLHAFERYKPNAHSTFKTYATHYILGEMRHYLRDKLTLIKTPRHISQLYYRMNQLVHKLSVRFGRTPTDAELAEELECSVPQVAEAHAWERRRDLLPLNEFLIQAETPNNDDTETYYLEALLDKSSQKQLAEADTKLQVQEAVSRLKPEFQQVVGLLYFKDMSQAQAAKQLGLSQMQVNRQLKKALNQLARYFPNAD
jgi:RNA polymerase sigma-B factor